MLLNLKLKEKVASFRLLPPGLVFSQPWADEPRVDEVGGRKAQVARRAAAPHRDARRRAVGLANYFD